MRKGNVNNVFENFGFSLNLCNDTNILCYENKTNRNELYFDSSLIYRDAEGKCTKLTGTFYKNQEKNYKNYLYYQYDKNKKNEIIKYIAPQGEKCYNDINFTTEFTFYNKDVSEAEVKYMELNFETYSREGHCSFSIPINLNFDDSKDYLYVQRFTNDFWVFTGIVFFIIGLYLIILAKNKKATKIVISAISGQIISFSIACGIFGLKIQYMEWVIFIVGLIIAFFFGYFTQEDNRLFRIILSLTAGFIFGILTFDIIFLHQNYQIAPILLFNSIIIFMMISLVSIYLLPEYHYFCDSIIGSYIFIRGISILFQKIGDNTRYRELQLVLYLINNFELDYAEYLYDEQWPNYYVYYIFIFLFMVVSMLFYYVKAVEKDDDVEEEEEEKDQDKKLIGEKSTALEDIEVLE